MRHQFGDCVLDLETRELSRGGRPLTIEPKAFRLLELLVEARPKALSKSELQDSLWPNTYVSEGSLARLVAQIRAAIGDRAERPRFIRTVHGYGYAFSGEVVASDRPRSARQGLHCRLVWGEREIALAPGENILGRDPDALVWIDLDSVSRRHARIVVSGMTATLEDLGSKNGTYLRGEKIGEPKALQEGDSIRFGSVTLTLRAVSGEGSTATEIGASPVGDVSSPAPPRRGRKRGTP